MQLKFLQFTFSLHTLGIMNIVTCYFTEYIVVEVLFSQSCFGFESLDEDFKLNDVTTCSVFTSNHINFTGQFKMWSQH